MRKKQNVVTKVLDSYKIPSKDILWHRNVFFGLWRRCDDQTTTWLKRVQNCVRRCEFSTNFTELLLIDRFVCGLNAKELNSFKRAKKSWTFEHLLQHFSKENNDTTYIEVALKVAQSGHQIENVTLEVVKSEPKEEACLENDPLNESENGTNLLMDIKPTVNVIEEVLPPEENTSTEGEQNHMSSQQVLNEDIDYEMLNSGMEFECEEYKFSVKDLVPTDNTSVIQALVPSSTTNNDPIVNNVDKHLLDGSIEGKMQEIMPQNRYSNVAGAPCITVIATSVISDAFISSEDVIVPPIDISVSDADKNLSKSSIEKEPNKNDQQNHYSNITATSAAVDNFTAINNPASSTNATVIIIDDVDEILPERFNQKPTYKELRYHVNVTAEGRTRYTCKQCNRSSSTVNKLELHIKDVHEGIRDYLCEQCGKRYVTPYELQTHARTHTGERPYKCDQCDVSYAYPNILKKHKKSVHLGLRPDVCQICDKRFVNKSQLSDHLTTHSSVRSFECEQCNKRFKRKSILRTHKKRVHQLQIRSHVCPVCDKRFMVAAELRKHSITHTGERPHSCDQCDKSFSQMQSLKLHKNAVHQGIRPHACSHCDKRFKTIVHLKQHLTIHTGEKPYTCDQCNKSFALGHHLSSHRKSVHQLKA